jgi:hypothetical protein
LGGEGGVVRSGDGSDDGEAEAVAVAIFVVGAAGAEALEWLEETIDFVGRDDRPRVRHREDRLAVCGIGGDLDEPALDVVGVGVVDKVGDETFDESEVAVERGESEGGLDVEPEPVGVGVEVREDGFADVCQVGSLPLVEAGFAAHEGEESFDQGLLGPVGGE